MKSGTPGFYGDRLKEAREARGINATSLADMLGVSRSMVTYYESGAHTPQPEVFESICQVLNLPRVFFLRPPSQDGNVNTLFFRSTRRPSRLPQLDRLRAKRRHAWLKDTVEYLRQFLHLPDMNVPQFAEGNGFLRLTMEQIEHFAAQCRDAWELGDGPIPDIILALESNGVIVSRSEFDADNIDAHSEWSKGDQTPFTVLGDDKGSALRSRFDAAHEAAHHMLHRDVTEETNDEHHQLIESQANRFASAFLLPAETFTRDFFAPNLDEFLNLTEKWKVSVAAQIERCKHLGIVDSHEYKKLRIQLSRRGWMKGEPHDGRMKTEQPRLLNRSVRMLVDNGVLTQQEILDDLALAESDFEQLANLPSGYMSGNMAAIQHLVRLRPGVEQQPPREGEAKVYDLFDQVRTANGD